MTKVELRISMVYDKIAEGWRWCLIDDCCHHKIVATDICTGFDAYHDAWVAAQEAQANAFRGH